METPTFEGFVEFVNNQPSDKVIDHSFWESCSVGEYVASIDNTTSVGSVAWEILPRGINALLGDTNKTVLEIVVPTYGVLATVLNEHVDKYGYGND